MEFRFAHNNFNVVDLEKSIEFYEKALGFKVARKFEGPGFTLAYLTDGGLTPHELELTWLHDRTKPYDLGENEFHLAVAVDDFKGAYAKHKTMGCICYENTDMGIYFINDPDGYWIEVIPEKQ